LLAVPRESSSIEQQATSHEVPPSRLFLRPGKYRLTATDRNNRLLGAAEIEVENKRPIAEIDNRLPPYSKVEHAGQLGAPIR